MWVGEGVRNGGCVFEPRIEDIVRLKMGEGRLEGGWGDLNQQPSQVKRTLKVLYNKEKKQGEGAGGLDLTHKALSSWRKWQTKKKNK